MASIKIHRVKGHAYYALEQSYREGPDVKRHYIAYLGSGSRVSAYHLPKKRHSAGWTPGEQKLIIEIAQYRGRQSKITETHYQDRGKAGKKPRTRRRRRFKSKRVIERTRMTGVERQALRKWVINQAREQRGQEWADKLADEPIEDYVDPDLGYYENKELLGERYSLQEKASFQSKRAEERYREGRVREEQRTYSLEQTRKTEEDREDYEYMAAAHKSGELSEADWREYLAMRKKAGRATSY